MSERFAHLRRLRSTSELESVRALAAAQNHPCLLPTHAIWKAGNIVGHLSIGQIPIVFGHLSMTDLAARESFHLINTAEDLVFDRSRLVVFPVGSTSPFHPLMEDMGFRNLINTDLFVKES